MHNTRLGHVMHLKSNRVMNKYHGIIVFSSWVEAQHLEDCTLLGTIFVCNSMDLNQVRSIVIMVENGVEGISTV
jgi:hypothetical protein